MAGYRILKAMEGSEAPIYVVVKSFAASMAATITTLAEKSFIYPNAIMLHHQISQSFTFSSMNLTEQKENVEDLKKWWARLADPIAEKMGITSDEFIEMMYKKTVTGDWTEFGDDAVKLKWADHVVSRIHETAPNAGCGVFSEKIKCTHVSSAEGDLQAESQAAESPPGSPRTQVHRDLRLPRNVCPSRFLVARPARHC